MGDASNFLLENQEAIVASNDGRVLYIELPASVELEVTYTEPGLQGDRSTGGTKPATVETGATVAVPLFITTGERIKVDTRDSSLPRSRAVLVVVRRPAPRRASARSTCSTPPSCGGESATEALDRAIDEGEGPTNEYTSDLVRGVVDHQPRIDEVLASYSEGWALERMPAVDRNVLRLGIYELLYVDDVPDAVAVSEAMALVRDLSTDESPQFVNGVLGAVLRNKPTLV